MLALVLTVPANEAELAADVLWALGVLAVEERAADEQAPGFDAPAGSGTEDRMIELWTSLGDDLESVRRAAEGFPARWRWHTREIDPSTVEAWRAHAVASWISPDLVVVPAWLEDTIPEPVTSIRIEPGATFGLGDHPTTVLSLRALQATLWPEATVLDVGCGSGVLGITAAVLGAPYVESVDISETAVVATVSNSRLNGVESKVNASTRALSEIDEPFDIVVANILAPAIISLAPELQRLTRPAGVLIVSGLLDAASDHVVEALAPMQVVDRLVREGWVAVVLRF